MRLLSTLGIPQGILPPHERPNIGYLKRLGFTGTAQTILTQAYKTAPELFSVCCSASAMWVANAATISGSTNTRDGRVHITPTNLHNQLHRSTEVETTTRALQAIFHDPHYFCHHNPLPTHQVLGDEGAANHMHLCADIGHAGLEIFVFGRSEVNPKSARPTKYPLAKHAKAVKPSPVCMV